MASRNIADLDPVVRRKAEQWLIQVEAAYPGKEVEALITNTLRTLKEQAALYAQGRTAPGKIVTWAQPGSSAHNYGLAFDFVPLVRGKPLWNPKTTEEKRIWARMGEIGESLGLEWGGRWAKSPDMPHLQQPNWRGLIHDNQQRMA